MTPLNRKNLSDLMVRAAQGPARGPATVRILQIGDGDFLRGFADWMIDVANGQGLMNAEVTVVSPRSAGVVARLAAQDGLYTVVTRGLARGAAVDERRLVTCVTEALNPRERWADVVSCAVDPRTRFCISNTTEAGSPTSKRRSALRRPTVFPPKSRRFLGPGTSSWVGRPRAAKSFSPASSSRPTAPSCSKSCCGTPNDGRCPQAFRAGCASTTTSSIRWSIASCRGFPPPTADAVYRARLSRRHDGGRRALSPLGHRGARGNRSAAVGRASARASGFAGCLDSGSPPPFASARCGS